MSDKIAILNKGNLKCLESPKYLKSKSCQAYKLVVKKSKNFNEIVFKNIIELFDENYLIETNHCNEISLYVSNNSPDDIYQFLKNIEDNNIYIGYESYSVCSPTLDEVFLRQYPFLEKNIQLIIFYLRMGKLDDNDDDRSFFNKSKSDIENHEMAKSKVKNLKI